MTDPELAEMERVVDRMRRTLSPVSTIATTRYLADVERLLRTVRTERKLTAELRYAIRRLREKCRTTAESARMRAWESSDPELRGRLLGQSACLEYLVRKLSELGGA